MSQEAAASGSREAQARPAEAQEEEMCPICLDPPVDRTRIIPCRHTFCRICIVRWAADRGNCPLCRQLVGALVSILPRPPANAATRRPRRRRLRRSQRRRERSPHRSRSVSPRRAQRSPSRRPRRLVRGPSWQRELNGRRRDAEAAEDAEDADWLREVQERQREMNGRRRDAEAAEDAEAADWLREVLERQRELIRLHRDAAAAEAAEDVHWLREVQERQWGSGDHAQARIEPRG